MNTKPVLSSITIYPVKSLNGISLDTAIISEGGCLLHDREFAICNEAGNLINGKTNSLVHSLLTAVHFDTETISFRHVDTIEWTHFSLEFEKKMIGQYLSNHFGRKAFLLRNRTGRFLDIPDVSGATVVSAAALRDIAGWYNIDIEETRKRFRATIEIENVPAFWEDRLFFSETTGIHFKIGDVSMVGMSPRARCVVPTRHPETAEITHAFAKSFSHRRSANLPEWSTLKNFGHYYHLTVDCSIPSTEVGKKISVGDEIRIVGEMSLN